MGVDSGAANSENRAREEALGRCGNASSQGPAFDPRRVYRLVAKHSGRVLDVNLPDRDQADVVQHTWHGGDNQRWKIEPLGDGTYRLVAKHSGRVLDVNLPDRDQANVVQHRWHGGDNQRWKIELVE
jgi:elongation factor Tu